MEQDVCYICTGCVTTGLVERQPSNPNRATSLFTGLLFTWTCSHLVPSCVSKMRHENNAHSLRPSQPNTARVLSTAVRFVGNLRHKHLQRKVYLTLRYKCWGDKKETGQLPLYMWGYSTSYRL